jgi:hypothetical protein
MCNTYCFSTATVVCTNTPQCYVSTLHCVSCYHYECTNRSYSTVTVILLAVMHFPYHCVTSLATASLPLPLRHFPCHCVTSLATASLPLPLRHFPCHCFTSLATASLPLPLRHFPCHCVTSLTTTSLPLPLLPVVWLTGIPNSKG